MSGPAFIYLCVCFLVFGLSPEAECANTGMTVNCDSCIAIEKCPLFQDMSLDNQKKLLPKFSCSTNDVPTTTTVVPFGFSPLAKGDFVCCDSKIWGVENLPSDTDKLSDNSTNRHSENLQQFSQNHDYNQNNYNTRPQHNYRSDSNNRPSNFNTRPSNYNQGFDRQNNRNNWQNDNESSVGPSWNRNQNSNSDYKFRNGNLRQRPATFGGNSFRNEDPYYNSGNTNGAVGNSGTGNFGGQCPITSFPPIPDSGCCGREAAESDRITDAQNAPKPPSQGSNHHYHDPPASSWMPSWMSRLMNFHDNDTSQTQSSENTPVSVDSRITGGSQTDFEQFPWTVLLKTTFTKGNQDSTFSCGGSIISSRYVLTAAHCVSDEGSIVKQVEIYLSEYDKRTFPTDCVGRGRGRRCIENIVLQASNVILHSEYDDKRLQNDIALIRMRGTAPYTDYIRPICLPPIDIDSNNFSNLPLAVAGWGRDGKYNSDVKQSTIVNLVPQRECKRNYPFLTRRHLCAAGYKGEDTCKGDSGGPLMIVYQGKYFVSGIVSGKRADSPCGTSVPSLYTNVYHYTDWINSNIVN